MPGLTQSESPERSGRDGGLIRWLRRHLGDRRQAATTSPVACEGGRPVAHHRPGNLQHEVTPGAAAAAAVDELVGQPNTADEGECTVDHQELAVIPEEVLQALAQRERIEESQVRPGIAEPAAVRRAQTKGAEGVEEHMDPYAALGATGKRIDESPRDRAGLDEIHLEQNRLARRGDRLEHPPEDAIALGEQTEAVALPPGPAAGDAHGRMRLQRQPDGTFSARHERLFYALQVALTLAVFGPLPALGNVVAAVNRTRIAYCGLPRAAHQPLAERRELDAVARLVAQGESLGQAELRAGYRAARSLWIEVSGARDDAALERMLSARFCAQLTDPRLRYVGVFGHGADGLWIVLAQPFSTPAIEDSAEVSRLVLALTNRARAHGRTCGAQFFPPAPPLALAPALTRAALTHSQDMAAHDFFSHTGSDGSTPGLRVTRAGYRWSMMGENVASGVRTPREAVAGWLASPHHCANIMTAGFRHMGVAFAVNRLSGDVIYWTEDFGKPR